MMMNATEITIELPERTQRYRAGNEGYPEPPAWIYLDAERREVAASELPAGCSREQRPDWMSGGQCVELLALWPNLASLEPIRQELERLRGDLETLADELTQGVHPADTGLMDIQYELDVAQRLCPRMVDFDEAVEDRLSEVEDLVAKGSVAAYVRHFDAGEDWVVDPADVRSGIAIAVAEQACVAEEFSDQFTDQEHEMIAKAQAIIAADDQAA